MRRVGVAMYWLALLSVAKGSLPPLSVYSAAASSDASVCVCLLRLTRAGLHPTNHVGYNNDA